mmetsp:Transcript_693/g.1423  ORF Transcript_693/g.1423 Transcript_693/m.1423 type:complete len:91 (-) Transcript_693:281-553(-)
MSPTPPPTAIPIMAVVLSDEFSSLELSRSSAAEDGGEALGGVTIGLDEGFASVTTSVTTGDDVNGASVVNGVMEGGKEGTFEDKAEGLSL